MHSSTLLTVLSCFFLNCVALKFNPPVVSLHAPFGDVNRSTTVLVGGQCSRIKHLKLPQKFQDCMAPDGLNQEQFRTLYAKYHSLNRVIEEVMRSRVQEVIEMDFQKLNHSCLKGMSLKALGAEEYLLQPVDGKLECVNRWSSSGYECEVFKQKPLNNNTDMFDFQMSINLRVADGGVYTCESTVGSNIKSFFLVNILPTVKSFTSTKTYSDNSPYLEGSQEILTCDIYYGSKLSHDLYTFKIQHYITNGAMAGDMAKRNTSMRGSTFYHVRLSVDLSAWLIYMPSLALQCVAEDTFGASVSEKSLNIPTHFSPKFVRANYTAQADGMIKAECNFQSWPPGNVYWEFFFSYDYQRRKHKGVQQGFGNKVFFIQSEMFNRNKLVCRVNNSAFPDPVCSNFLPKCKSCLCPSRMGNMTDQGYSVNIPVYMQDKRDLEQGDNTALRTSAMTAVIVVLAIALVLIAAIAIAQFFNQKCVLCCCPWGLNSRQHRRAYYSTDGGKNNMRRDHLANDNGTTPSNGQSRQLDFLITKLDQPSGKNANNNSNVQMGGVGSGTEGGDTSSGSMMSPQPPADCRHPAKRFIADMPTVTYGEEGKPALSCPATVEKPSMESRGCNTAFGPPFDPFYSDSLRESRDRPPFMARSARVIAEAQETTATWTSTNGEESEDGGGDVMQRPRRHTHNPIAAQSTPSERKYQPLPRVGDIDANRSIDYKFL